MSRPRYTAGLITLGRPKILVFKYLNPPGPEDLGIIPVSILR